MSDYKEGISIIVPVYNVEKWLDKCLSSVADQSDKRYQLIVVNDGSQDGSEDVFMEWRNSFVDLVYIKQDNSGLGAARNAGVKAATREYLTFVDSDDWIDGTFVESMLLACEYDAVYCDCRYVIDENDPGVIADFRSCQQEAEADVFTRMAYGYPNMWGAIYKTSIWKDNLLSIPEGIYEDTAYYGVMLEYFKKIGCVKKPLYYYRTNRNGSLMQQGRKNPQLMLAALERLIDRAEDRGIFKNNMAAYEAFCIRQLENEWEKIINKVSDFDENEGRNRFGDFLDRHFKGWQQIYDKDLIAVGSYNSSAVYNRIKLFRQAQFKKYQFFNLGDLIPKTINESRYSFRSIKNKFRIGMIRKLIENSFAQEINEKSVIVLDLLNETNDLINIDDMYISKSEALMEALDLYGEMEVIPWWDERNYERFKEACAWFEGLVKEKGLKVIILEVYFAKEYKDGYILKPFDNVEELTKKNEYLRKCYRYMESTLYDAEFVEMDKRFAYTSKNFPFGCEPQHLNEFEYSLMALNIVRKLYQDE